MNSHFLRLAIILAALASSCRRLSPPPSGSQPGTPSALPEPTAATPLPPPVPPLSDNARTEDERNTIAVFRDASAAVVFVTQTRVVIDYLGGTAQEVPAGSGSGFVWDDNGNVVTNFHVVQNARSLTVTFHDQQSFEPRLGGVEPRKEIGGLGVNPPKNLLKPVT